MKFISRVSSIIFAVAFLSGCVAGKTNLSAIRMPIISLPESISFEVLKRSDYKVTGPATGTVCLTLQTKDGHKTVETDNGIVVAVVAAGNVAMQKSNMLTMARRLAMSRAIKSIRGADALISPTYSEEFKLDKDDLVVCATVSGKAIIIKTDEEKK